MKDLIHARATIVALFVVTYPAFAKQVTVTNPHAIDYVEKDIPDNDVSGASIGKAIASISFIWKQKAC